MTHQMKVRFQVLLDRWLSRAVAWYACWGFPIGRRCPTCHSVAIGANDFAQLACRFSGVIPLGRELLTKPFWLKTSTEVASQF